MWFGTALICLYPSAIRSPLSFGSTFRPARVLAAELPKIVLPRAHRQDVSRAAAEDSTGTLVRGAKVKNSVIPSDTQADAHVARPPRAAALGTTPASLTETHLGKADDPRDVAAHAMGQNASAHVPRDITKSTKLASAKPSVTRFALK